MSFHNNGILRKDQEKIIMPELKRNKSKEEDSEKSKRHSCLER